MRRRRRLPRRADATPADFLYHARRASCHASAARPCAIVDSTASRVITREISPRPFAKFTSLPICGPRSLRADEPARAIPDALHPCRPSILPERDPISQRVRARARATVNKDGKRQRVPFNRRFSIMNAAYYRRDARRRIVHVARSRVRDTRPGYTRLHTRNARARARAHTPQ